jgi:pyridoxamine 5'-phosphate oxidase
MAQSVADLRREYVMAGLSEADADTDPIRQFACWFQQALAAGVLEPNAMTLATCTPDGRPSARIVLLKGYDERGFAFFTNYASRKGHELATNPEAALVFFWPEIERQVRIEGTTTLASADESDAYFASRPRDSQLGAWASDQSEVLGSREELEQRFRLMEGRFAGGPVPRPPHWAGFRVKPVRVEFWQGRPGRLHDRLCYTRQADHSWKRERLAP